MDLPPYLVEQARQGRLILFLGAGASLESVNSNGQNAPNATKLGELLSDRFLGGLYKNLPLATISEYAISESNLHEVQNFLYQTFVDFRPTAAHALLPRFVWGGIATTNYDLLVEKAYSLSLNPLQNPKAFVENGDRVTEALRDPKSVMFLKLHGCITRISNERWPLILSTDQYINYRSGRDRLFSHLQDWSYEHAIVFVGHGLQDQDLRETIFRLHEATEIRPRHYIVAPSRGEIESRFWESKKVTTINCTFSEFINALDEKLANDFRGLVIQTNEPTGISRYFSVSGVYLSRNCSQWLATDAQFVTSSLPTKPINPSEFYRGHNGGWAPIEQNLDVRRAISDDVISDHFLIDQGKASDLNVILLKGPAGGGKSVILRRIAWDAANEYECICLYLNDFKKLNIGAIEELVDLCKRRIYIFIDNAADRSKDIQRFIEDAGQQRELVTLVIAARTNEWNSVSTKLQAQVRSEFEVSNLRHNEVSHLLDLLAVHNSLGRLSDLEPEARLEAFRERAGRQILVALHEATLGKPFEEILEDEYKNLVPQEAQLLYLTVCILNRLGTPVRAGIISRIHNIPFSEFETRLFRPLEHVVFANFDPSVRDNVYVTRHEVIAEIVFERILRDQKDRYYAYTQCLEALNVDYASDRRAFQRMIKGREISTLFSNSEFCEEIFRIATAKCPEDPFLFQQRAIYEMRRNGGNLDEALRFIDLAISVRSGIRAFKHTKAEILLKKADKSRTPLEREKYLRSAHSIAGDLRDIATDETHSYHTIAKIHIMRLEEAISKQKGDFSKPVVQNIIKEVEKVLTDGLRRDPRSSYLLSSKAELSQLINNIPDTIDSLRRAVEANPKLSFLAIRLADCYDEAGDIERAKVVYRAALDANRTDQLLNYRYALFLGKLDSPAKDLSYFLKRSFTPGDLNFDAQLRYARSLFLAREYAEAPEEFRRLRNDRRAPQVSGQRLYEASGRYFGTVVRIRSSDLTVEESESGIWVHIPNDCTSGNLLEIVVEGSRVSFGMAFNFLGLIGFECQIDQLI